jgi:hypothetical protein
MASRVGRHQMKTLGFLLLVTAGWNVYGQKIADIDPRNPRPPLDRSSKMWYRRSVELQNTSIPNGAVVSSKRRLQLNPKLAILNGKTFSLGDRVRGEVLMRNTGPDAVEIPWTVDSQISTPELGSLQRDYDSGWFEVEIKDQHAPGIRLESESVSSFLYSSPSAPETSLRLEPGQWIVARFDFNWKKITNRR